MLHRITRRSEACRTTCAHRWYGKTAAQSQLEIERQRGCCGHGLSVGGKWSKFPALRRCEGSFYEERVSGKRLGRINGAFLRNVNFDFTAPSMRNCFATSGYSGWTFKVAAFMASGPETLRPCPERSHNPRLLPSGAKVMMILLFLFFLVCPCVSVAGSELSVTPFVVRRVFLFVGVNQPPAEKDLDKKRFRAAD